MRAELFTMRAYLWATLDEGVRGRGVSHTGLMGMVESECAVRTMWCVYGVRHVDGRESMGVSERPHLIYSTCCSWP